MKKTLFGLLISLYSITTNAQEFDLKWAISPSGGECWSHETTSDKYHNIFVFGNFRGTVDFNPSENTNNLISTQYNIFLAKYDSDGNYIWAINIDDQSNSSQSSSISTDDVGNIFISGRFKGIVDFDPSSNITNLTSVGSTNYFLAKYDTNGHFIWAKNTGDIDFRGLLIKNEIIYATGSYSGTIDFDFSENVVNLNLGNTDYGFPGAFIAKYDSNGNYIFANNIGHLSFSTGSDISADKLGNIYITGTEGSGGGIFFTKIDSSGNILWTKTNNCSDCSGRSIDIGKNGDLIISGSFKNTLDFDPSTDVSNQISNGEEDIFIAKYNSEGEYIWVKTIGGINSDYSKGAKFDLNDNVIAIGSYYNTANFNDSGTSDYLASSGHNYFLVKYDSNGNYLTSKNIIVSKTTQLYNSVDLNLNDLGNITVLGRSSGDVSFGETSLTNPSSNTLFLAQFSNTVTLGLKKSTIDEVSLYPNPHNGNFNLNLETFLTQKISIRILNIQGKEIYSILTNPYNTKVLNIDISNYSKSIYFVELVGGNEKKILKMIKE